MSSNEPLPRRIDGNRKYDFRASHASVTSVIWCILVGVETTVTSTEAKNRLNALLADVERTGQAVTITNHGRPVAKLVPVQPLPRKLGQLPNLVVPKDFDEPLPESELEAWEGSDS
jgi:prevent-host-death family protein